MAQGRYVKQNSVEFLVCNLLKSKGSVENGFLLGQVSALYQLDLISKEEFDYLNSSILLEV